MFSLRFYIPTWDNYYRLYRNRGRAKALNESPYPSRTMLERLRFRPPRSISLTKLRSKPAFSANVSWVKFFASRRFRTFRPNATSTGSRAAMAVFHAFEDFKSIGFKQHFVVQVDAWAAPNKICHYYAIFLRVNLKNHPALHVTQHNDKARCILRSASGAWR